MFTDPITAYLAKRADFSRWPLISGEGESVDQAVVIPILAEKGYLTDTFNSLCANPPAELDRTLVICVVNNRADADPAQIAENQETLATLDRLVRSGARLPSRLAYVDASSPGNELPTKGGVGLARKIGMDWALKLLHNVSSRPRLIISLDADTLVEPNYLKTIRRHFEDTGAWAAVVDYAHPITGTDAEQAAILCYEFYLRYHELGLRYAGSPYAYPAIGSTIVCRNDAYAAAGGMNRRQGGEDFYFLQQLAKTGGVSRIHGTTVYPSGRPSQRAPLGTGQRVLRFLSGAQDEYRVYHPQSYRILKAWLALAHDRWDAHANDVLADAGEIHAELRVFLRDNQFTEVWERLRKHSRTADQMRQQFHVWFDAFRTLKLIHHLRDHGYPQQETFSAMRTVLNRVDSSSSKVRCANLIQNHEEQRQLLEYLRILIPSA